MKQYLIILLDDTSTSYCHYENSKTEHSLITLDDLKAGIFFGMKENLMIQYVLPAYELPAEFKEVMNTIDHHLIVPAISMDINALDAADVVVFNDWQETIGYKFVADVMYVLRISKADLFAQKALVKTIVGKVSRLNIVITDIESFTDDDFTAYKALLADYAKELEQQYVVGKAPQLNILTDRMMLKEMNNCGAGETNITLAPDGKFYVCPAFYYDGACDGSEVSLGDECRKGYAIGSLKDGLDIKNPQLYKLDHAPLCRKCDAYQCKRCVWLNRRTTLEVNTPSHEQCVVAHLERNSSRELLCSIRKHGTFLPEFDEIKEIDYLDPFDVKDEY